MSAKTFNLALNLSLPAVTRLLRRWGVLDRFYAAGAVPMPGVQVFHHERGLVLDAPFVNRGCHPYLVLDHPDIERVFLEEATRSGLVEVCYSTRVSGLVREGGRVCGVDVVRRGGEPARCLARLVVGADGATSAVRRLVGLELPTTPYDSCYYGINFERPEGYRDGMRLHLHPEGGLMIVPNRPGMVGAAVLVRAADRELFHKGPLAQKVEAIRRRAAILKDAAPLPEQAHLYPLVRAHAPRYCGSGAVLLGDAVHVTHPTGGQGMTMAIEDAAALAEHAGPALRRGSSDTDLDAALAGYERERRPLNAGLIRWSHLLGLGFGLQGRAADRLRLAFFSFCATRVGGWVRKGVWQRMGNRPGTDRAADGPVPSAPSLAGTGAPS